jgi:hypothetical protein
MEMEDLSDDFSYLRKLLAVKLIDFLVPVSGPFGISDIIEAFWPGYP